MKTKTIALSIAVVLGLVGCGQDKADTTSQQSAAAQNQSSSEKVALYSGIDQDNFDKSVPYSQDFYLAIDGNWLKKTKIPDDKSNFGSFTVLYDKSQLALKSIMEQAAADKTAAADSDAGKIGRFYNAYMDQKAADDKGITPLNDQLAAIASVDSYQKLAEVMGDLLIAGVDMPFGFYVSNDAKQSDQYAVYLGQAGLGLPDRDYYTKDDEKSRKLVADYQLYLTKMFNLASVSNAEQAAANTVDVEKWLAGEQWTRVENRDTDKTYNKKSMTEVKQLLGDFDWDAYATETGLADVDSVIVSQPSYLAAFGKGIKSIPLAQWQDYLRAQLLNTYAGYLSSDFDNAHFAFYGTTLSGVKTQPVRWKRAVSDADSIIGQMLGKLYVEQNFRPEAKQRMTTMVNNLIKSYESSIQSLDWMSPETKKKALDKLHKFTPKIGYPDKWKDYSALKLSSDDLVGNIRAAAKFAYDDMLAKLGQPIDTTEWHMTPQTINAYYNPVMNEIVFPAAILQPPFFDMNADDAVNYGAIGAVIGHEIGHGFDDQGSKYDGDGNLHNWWTEQDRKEFEKRTNKLVAQYDAYKPFDDVHVNGHLTLGENIGDLGGVSIAYKAYHMSLGDKPAPELDGFTGDQRFFIGWAQIWRRKYREQELRQRLITDPHSPSHYRVNGVLPNVPAFYTAFDIKEGDAMYLAPEDRVKIW